METKQKSFGQKVKDLWKRFWGWVKHPPRLSPKKSLLTTMVLLFLTALGMTLLNLAISTQDFTWSRYGSYFSHPVIFLLNFLPVLLLTVFFYFACNRAWFAPILPAVISLVICCTSYFKVVLRGDPLILTDFAETGECAGMLGNYSLIFPVAFYLFLAFWVISTVLLLRYGRFRVPKKRWWVRIVGLVLCIGLGAMSWSLWYSSEEFYNRQENYENFSPRTEADIYASHGTFYSLLDSVNDAFQTAPEGYSEEEARQVLENYPSQDIPEDQKVNIVVTMLESFSDLSVNESIRFTADPYEEYHELLKECCYGTMISDTVGGGTVNAERSFLTGYAYPHPGYHAPTDSYVRYFADQGYSVVGGHPGHDWFYNREKVNKLLGFEDYRFIENHYGVLTGGDYANDDIFFPEQVKLYDQVWSQESPCFSFSISFQNHSPYDSKAMTGTEYVSPEGISHEAYCVVNNYLNGIADTGKRVCAYVDTFRDREEPVVLMFFGDHRPTLGDHNTFYEEMGVDVTEGLPEGCANLYSTPYWIWANDAALEILQPEIPQVGPTISPTFLMTELFDFCGWEGSSWLQYERQVRETLPVIHRERLFGTELTPTLTAEEQAVYDEFNKVQFYQRTRLEDSQK